MEKKKEVILHSCYHKKRFEREHLVEDHAITFVQSGSLQFTTAEGLKVFKIGEIAVIRRNQLAKSEKFPDVDGNPVKTVTIFLNQEALRQYAMQNAIEDQPIYSGHKILRVSPNRFLEAFFLSLLPYYDQPEALSKPIMELKIKEAIELLLRLENPIKSFLFDFSGPHKIDLEAFMLRNYEYNVPIREYARLCGRSISTFKRDFQKVFNATPERWLKETRLEKARYLIKEKKQKPVDVYLRVGFENLSHFSTEFKAYFGFNPSSLF
jgi:AraC-like DNA-binding protein